MATSDPEIRRYVPEDRAAVVELFALVNRALAPSHLREAFEAYIDRSIAEEIGRIEAYYAGGGFWLAILDEELAGMFGLEPAGPGTLELRRMYVAPSARRRGLARRMLAVAEQEARHLGATQLHLSTSELQTAALALYRQAGYRQIREETAGLASNKTIGGGIRRYHFVKTL